MTALSDQIVTDGDTPWCIGIECGGATGWPATDWIEDIMLRTTSLENYDKWTKGELPFTDPVVKNAFQKMTDIWFNDKYVYGGRAAIATTAFGDAPAPMLQDPPKCWLHRQGTFITSFMEKAKPGMKAGVDYDFFYLPPIDSQYGKPVLFAGDLFSVFNDRPEVRAVMEYLHHLRVGPALDQARRWGDLATQELGFGRLHQRPGAQSGRNHSQRLERALRWLGPDAGRGWRR